VLLSKTMKKIALVLIGLVGLVLPGVTPLAAQSVGKTASSLARMDDAAFKDWEARWEKNITGEAQNRACDKELGEEIGWLMAPLLNGFYYGYLATGDTRWIDMLIDWTDSWNKRAVTEPDGYPGWPKVGAAGTDKDNLNSYDADSLLGEAMVLRPVVLMSKKILETPALKEKYGAKAESYLKLSAQLYDKWDRRGAWRETEGGGEISVVLPFGIDPKTGQWTDGYATRNAPGNGFSHPDNKANAVACWLLAMSDATGQPVYRDRAEKWFRLMKSRMALSTDGATYQIWNYWQPAGPWDYKPDGSTKHWVGVHPNGGYYSVDTDGIVTAYEHGLVFTRDDINRLIATALADKRYWSALAPYDPTIQQQFVATLKPESWSGLSAAPWYLSLQAKLRPKPSP
jgi:hypothetical protein